jgi:hypothetical protein
MQTASDRSLEEFVELGNSDRVALFKFLVPSSDALRAMADLDGMGLNHSRMYPGLDGGAKAARMRFLINLKRAEATNFDSGSG